MSHATTSYILRGIKCPKNNKYGQDLTLALKEFQITEEKRFIFSTAAPSGTARRDKEFKKAQKLTLDIFYREKVLGGLLSVNGPVLLSVLHLGSGFGLQ